MSTASLSRNTLDIGIFAVDVGFFDTLSVIDFNNSAGIRWPLLLVFGGLAALLTNPQHYMFPVGFIAIGILLQLVKTGIFYGTMILSGFAMRSGT